MLIDHSGCQLNRKVPAQEQDLTNQRFGALVALSHDHQGPHVVWHCKCDCGKTTVTRALRLIHGETISCGCRKEQYIKHGMANTPTYHSWRGIMQRCYNPNAEGYERYGGAGIIIFKPWHDFATFVAAVGERPKGDYSIDRFPNPLGNYEPGNVRWATSKEQARNRRNTRMITFKDRTQSLNDWADEVGIHPQTIIDRINKYSWSVEEALTTPPSLQSRKKRGLLPSPAEES